MTFQSPWDGSALLSDQVVLVAPGLARVASMVANAADLNVGAACQVAHALSTHAVATEFDYYTAVDDEAPGDETGAGMIGTITVG